MIYYHYTSLDAFFKIIKNKTFWLTSLRSSNDALELFYDVGQFKTDLSRVIASEQDASFKKWMNDIKKGIKKNETEFNNFCKPPKERDVFALSLCSKRDNLTHWDRYADRCAGICVGIDGEFIDRVLDEKQMEFFGKPLILINNVIYKERIIEVIRGFFFNEFYSSDKDKDEIEALYRNLPHLIASSVYVSIARFAKTQAFIDEQETRLTIKNQVKNGGIHLNRSAP